MAELDENERRIVNEFCQLLEKSKQLFNGLRYSYLSVLSARWNWYRSLLCWKKSQKVSPVNVACFEGWWFETSLVKSSWAWKFPFAAIWRAFIGVSGSWLELLIKPAGKTLQLFHNIMLQNQGFQEAAQLNIHERAFCQHATCVK